MALFLEDFFNDVFGGSGFNFRKPIFFGQTGSQTAILSGTGAPGTAGTPSATAPQGTLYLRTDGSSTSTRLYVATNSTGTYTAVTTVA